MVRQLQEKFAIYHSLNFMKKAKIYIPTKTAMQSGRGKLKNWILEFETKDPSTNPLMVCGSSTSRLKAVSLMVKCSRTSQDTVSVSSPDKPKRGQSSIASAAPSSE